MHNTKFSGKSKITLLQTGKVPYTILRNLDYKHKYDFNLFWDIKNNDPRTL